MARSPIDYTDLDGGTHGRIFSHTFLKKIFQKFFGALSEDPRGSTPASSDSSPRATRPEIFSRLSTSRLTVFTQALPTSKVTPTTTPRSDPPPRVTYLRYFPPLYIDFNIIFYSDTPTSKVNNTPTPYSDPPPRRTYPAIFSRLSTSTVTKILLMHSQPPTSPPLQTTVGSPSSH